MGLSGFQANYIQLGLDQLLDAHSDYLGLFIYWLGWIMGLGSLLITPVFLALGNCDHLKKLKHALLGLEPSLLLVLLLMVIFGCWKRRWFYSEPGQNNPYKTLFKVLNFARKYKYPLQRSAFTYTDDEEPTRIDFAKEGYGGPFTTEQVEDVKTFFKILALLLVLGPMFFLEIPGNATLYQYTQHTGSSIKTECSFNAVFQDIITLENVLIISVYPVYIWLIYTMDW